MELRHLRYFVAVAEELHFGRAALRLMVSQPPLSQQIKDLEEDVGVTLLARTRRRVELTEAGRIFLKEAKDILSRVDMAAKSARLAGNGHNGRLFVGYMAYAMIDVVPRVLEAFGQQFPQVDVVLERMVSTEQAQALRDKRIDIGLVCPPFLREGLEVETVLREPLIVVLPRKHVLARRRCIPLLSLANETFIFTNRHRDSGFLAQLSSICRAGGLELQNIREAHADDAILPMIASGLGVCLVPACARKVRYTGVVYRDLENCPGQVELAVAWRKHDGSALVRNFVKLIRSHGHRDRRTA